MLFKKTIDQLFDKTFADEYTKAMALFQEELSRFVVSKQIVDTIRVFPFKELKLQDDTIFFGTVVYNFMDSCMMIITKLFFDNDGDIITIPKLKNQIIQNFIDQEDKKYYIEHCKKYKDKMKIDESIKKAMQGLRNNLIAHFNKGVAFGSEKIDALSWDEFNLLEKQVISSFEAISLTTEYVLRPFEYDREIIKLNSRNNMKPPDIERLLSLIAMDCFVVNMPERNPNMWEVIKQNLAQSKRDNINKYRKMKGLTQI